MAELIIVQELAADPARVWRAWTDPQDWAEWLWPARFETVVDLDPAVGGRFHVRSEPMGMGVNGEYVRFDPPVAAEFTWTWDGEAEPTRVRLTLRALESGTEMTLHHSGFDSDATRDEHVQGWTDCLGRLRSHLA